MAMERARSLSLALGLLTTALMFLFPVDLSALGESARYGLSVLCRALNSWFWITALIGFGRRHLRFVHPALDAAREAALPFYVLHQTVIVVLGFGMAGWEIRIGLKYLLLGGLSFALILAVYALLVRPFGPMRFLFGMKPAK
jgi:hypothetical protein